LLFQTKKRTRKYKNVVVRLTGQSQSASYVGTNGIETWQLTRVNVNNRGEKGEPETAATGDYSPQLNSVGANGEPPTGAESGPDKRMKMERRKGGHCGKIQGRLKDGSLALKIPHPLPRNMYPLETTTEQMPKEGRVRKPDLIEKLSSQRESMI